MAIKVWSMLYSDQGAGIETMECLINDVKLLYFNVFIYCRNAVYNLFKEAFKNALIFKFPLHSLLFTLCKDSTLL